MTDKNGSFDDGSSLQLVSMPQSPVKNRVPYNYTPDPSDESRKETGVSFAYGVEPSPKLFCISVDGKKMFSCGYWDNSFKLYDVESGKMEQSVQVHHGVVTCIATSLDGRTLVTGSHDTTVMVWELNGSRIVPRPRLVLFGHEDEVQCVAVSTELDVVVSGGRDGSLLLHTLLTGTFVWSANPFDGAPVKRLIIAPVNGMIVAYGESESDDTSELVLYDVNGRDLHREKAEERSADFLVTPDGKLLITCGKSFVYYRTLHNLAVVHRCAVPANASSLTIVPDTNFVLAGLKDGHIVIMGSYRLPEFIARASRQLSFTSSML